MEFVSYGEQNCTASFFSTEQDIELFSVPLTVAFWITLASRRRVVACSMFRGSSSKPSLWPSSSPYTTLESRKTRTSRRSCPKAYGCFMASCTILIRGPRITLVVLMPLTWVATVIAPASSSRTTSLLDRDALDKMLQRFEIKPDTVNSSSVDLKATLSMTDFARAPSMRT